MRSHHYFSQLLILLLVSNSLFAQNYDARARDIVKQMTLDEKIQELHGIRSDNHNRYVPPIPRLGIPAFLITNGPAGAGPGDIKPQAKATALPSPIACASTWDIKLARTYGEVAGAESRDLGNSLLEAPTINIARVPQNGRTFEGYGEDPNPWTASAPTVKRMSRRCVDRDSTTIFPAPRRRAQYTIDSAIEPAPSTRTLSPPRIRASRSA